jgi:serine/threonine-protein kinase HipA
MDRIIEEVLSVVSTWNKVAQSIGISNADQNMMAKAFNV